MHMDTMIQDFTGIILLILCVGFILSRLKIPYVIAYLVVGIMIGPSGFGFIEDPAVLHRIEAIGVLLLLFFVGMEICLPCLFSGWKVSILGTFLQFAVTIGCVAILGHFMAWHLVEIVLIGSVISISSTAVILKILNEWNESKSPVGQDVVSILIVQDIAVIPIIILIELVGGKEPSLKELALQGSGALIMGGILAFLLIKKEFHMPFAGYFKNNPEMQVFGAMILCFGFAFLTEILHLSGALGAFLAGIIVGTAKETEWIHDSLDSFRVLFVALFFTSIGMLVDLSFIYGHWREVAFLTVTAIFTNTFINAGIMKLLGVEWKRSLYAASLLSQIGEFSIVIVGVALQAHIVGQDFYQMAIAVISSTLLISPFWISLVKKLTGCQPALLTNTQ